MRLYGFSAHIAFVFEFRVPVAFIKIRGAQNRIKLIRIQHYHRVTRHVVCLKNERLRALFRRRYSRINMRANSNEFDKDLLLAASARTFK